VAQVCAAIFNRDKRLKMKTTFFAFPWTKMPWTEFFGPLPEFGSSRRESVIGMTAPCIVERLNIVKDMRLS